VYVKANAGALDAIHEERTRRIAERLELEPPEAGPSFDCPYLAGRKARYVSLLARAPQPGIYHSLMDLNFRRTGPFFYRTACDGCSECSMLRVRVTEFRPSRSQARAWSRNRGVSVEVGPPSPTEEKHALYERYLETRHDGRMASSWEEMAGLYESPIETIEVVYRVAGRLVGVGLADAEPAALSAVYFYFDPLEARRSLGVFNILWLIEECRRTRRPYLYLGYFVRDSPKMSYKSAYRPSEVLLRKGFVPFGRHCEPASRRT